MKLENVCYLIPMLSIKLQYSKKKANGEKNKGWSFQQIKHLDIHI